MNLPLYIAQKLALSREKSFSRLIIQIAIAGVAISIAVMIVSIAIVTGFRSEIRSKVIGFGGHIQVTSLNMSNSIESLPLKAQQDFIPVLRKHPEIRHIQVFANKAGIIKTDDNIEGIVLKGIGPDFDWSFFDKNLISGRSFRTDDSTTNNDIVISDYTARKLNLSTGQDLVIYFIQQPVRARKLHISGIYKTGLEEFDKLFAIADINHVQRLNSYGKDSVSGFEILMNDFTNLDETTEWVNDNIEYDMQAKSIKENNPQIFDWLNLLDTNVKIIIGLMILVACINMITALLILIIERTNMIGILKALGCTNYTVSKIFLYKAGWLISAGLFFGNLFGLGLCFLQQKFNLIKLDQESYYVSVVPINLELFPILLLNAATLVICILVMIIPVLMISRITPVKAIRFD